MQCDINAATHNHQEPNHSGFVRWQPHAERLGNKLGRRATRGGSSCCRWAMVGVHNPGRRREALGSLATATLRRRQMHRPDAETALGAFDCRQRQDDVASIRWLRLKDDAARGPRLHRIEPRTTWLGSHRARARQSNDTQQLATPVPETPSSGERTTLSPVHDQKPRGSHRLSCASATCNSLRRQATGPQQRKGESGPNPRSCVRLTQVLYNLQARKVLKASLSCA